MTATRAPLSTPFASKVRICMPLLSLSFRVCALSERRRMESVSGLRSISRLVSGCLCSNANTTALETLFVRNSPISTDLSLDTGTTC